MIIIIKDVKIIPTMLCLLIKLPPLDWHRCCTAKRMLTKSKKYLLNNRKELGVKS